MARIMLSSRSSVPPGTLDHPFEALAVFRVEDDHHVTPAYGLGDQRGQRHALVAAGFGFSLPGGSISKGHLVHHQKSNSGCTR